MSRLASQANEAVSAFFEEKLTKQAKKAIAAALADLYSGPGAGGMSFTKATKILSDWWDEHGAEVTYDVQSGHVFEGKVEGYEDEETGEWIEPEWSDYVHYDSGDAKQAFFGSELAPHV